MPSGKNADKTHSVPRRRNISRLVVAAGLLAATVCVAPPARADEPVAPDTADPGSYPREPARLDLLLVGAGTSLFWYGSAVGFSYAWPDAPGALDLRIPVAGPWMSLSHTGCADDDPDCSTLLVVVRAVLTTIDAVGQAGGLLVVAESLFLPTTTAPAPPRRKRPAPRDEDAFRIRPVPVVAGRDGVGLGVVGTF